MAAGAAAWPGRRAARAEPRTCAGRCGGCSAGCGPSGSGWSSRWSSASPRSGSWSPGPRSSATRPTSCSTASSASSCRAGDDARRRRSRCCGRTARASSPSMISGMNVTPGSGVDITQLGQVLGLAALVYLLGAAFSFGQGYIMAGVTQRTMYGLRREVEEKLARLPLRYFDSHPHGDILSRVTNDIDNLTTTLQQGLSQLLTSVLTIVGVLGMMFWISPLLAAVSRGHDPAGARRSPSSSRGAPRSSSPPSGTQTGDAERAGRGDPHRARARRRSSAGARRRSTSSAARTSGCTRRASARSSSPGSSSRRCSSSPTSTTS